MMMSVLPVLLMLGNTSQPFQAARRYTHCSDMSPKRLGLMAVGPAVASLKLGIEGTAELEVVLDIVHSGGD